MIAFAPNPRDADFSADCRGVIGDSADKRFTFVRNDYVWWRSSLPTLPQPKEPDRE